MLGELTYEKMVNEIWGEETGSFQELIEKIRRIKPERPSNTQELRGFFSRLASYIGTGAIELAQEKLMKASAENVENKDIQNLKNVIEPLIQTEAD